MIVTEPVKSTSALGNEGWLQVVQQRLIKAVVPEVVSILRDSLAKEVLAHDPHAHSRQITIDLSKALTIRKELK